MAYLMRTPASIAWLVLVALTLISWMLGTAHGFGGDHVVASVVVLLVAAFKVRLVGLYFIELRKAPTWLRGTFEVYCVCLPALLIGMYLLA